MTVSSENNQQLIDSFRPMILENEANGLLLDLLAQPSLAMQLMGFSKETTLKAIKHLQNILEECYQAGHLKIATGHEDGCLYGYALLFIHPDPNVPRYCHKIFIYQEYRGLGIGSKMLQMLLNDSQDTYLLCRNELVPFYERAGMQRKGDFVPPSAHEGFALTNSLYAGLVVMGSPGGDGTAPVFMLNDEDVKQLLVMS
jgi:GNAT superfamily N-acetyltransferase